MINVKTENYFEVYSLVLSKINEERPDDLTDLLKVLQQHDLTKEILSEYDYRYLVTITEEVASNLIDDGLIKGNIIGTMDGNIYDFQGITTRGYEYINALENDNFKNKAINYLKENGLPVNPQSITKAVSNLFL